MLSNIDFLTAIFAEDLPWTHVTDFVYDPGNIPKGQELVSWKGDYFSRYRFAQQSNQYFTISNFYVGEHNTARRKKSLYRHTRCIVLDDVKEKLQQSEVDKLPPPSWILETSPGSEQWGYILNTPCADRARVENLLDGLVNNGLAPGGKDPGMKGVTRYVRLPEGHNNKASKLVNGLPFKCVMKLWQPFVTTTLERLAAPLFINLDAARRESRIDGAADISDHPLLSMPDIITVKEVRSDGRFDVICPWVDEHTGGEDSGSAIFTNKDYTIGFKCHHGNCQSRTGADLLRLIETKQPGFNESFSGWKLIKEFSKVATVSFMATATPQSEISFMAAATPQSEISFMAAATPAPLTPTISDSNAVAVTDDNVDTIKKYIDLLRRERPTSREARQLSAQILKAVDQLPQIDKLHWHDQVCDLMAWNKTDFKDILKDLRSQWYADAQTNCDFLDSVVFVKEINQFYDWKSRMFFTGEAFQNSFCHIDPEARKTALQDGRVTKVDKLNYAPKRPRVFEELGLKFANTWCDSTEVKGVPGDVSKWLEHFTHLGWEAYQSHILQWIAYTIIHPETKVNHMLLLGSNEGCGKDFLLYPLIKAMGENSLTIAGEELLDGFNDYLLGTKHLHVNEAELGDRKEATAVSNKLKPIAAGPPDQLRVNQKGIKPIKVDNIVNGTMTTNSQLPLRLNGPSRRFFAVWSDLNTRDEYENMTSEWLEYWTDRWAWMKSGGAEACIWYLRNCVDLSKFNPALPPPMTQFLRDIRDASKTPAVQTVEAFIRQRRGAFHADLVSSSDAANTLRVGEMVAPDITYCNSNVFTPTRVGQLLKELPQCIQLQASRGRINTRVWTLRDTVKYKSMTTSQLYDEYERQSLLAKAQTTLTVVNN